jgi:hypothetical protein
MKHWLMARRKKMNFAVVVKMKKKEDKIRRMEINWADKELKEELYEFSVRMFFKGLSITGIENSISGSKCWNSSPCHKG